MRKRARVVSWSKVTVPNTDSLSALCIITSYPYATAGERYPETGIYLGLPWPNPLPATDEPIEWEGHKVWIRGVQYNRVDHEFNPDPRKPFH